MLAVTAAAVANSVSSGVGCARKCLREGPAHQWHFERGQLSQLRQDEEVLIAALAESQVRGRVTMRALSMPPWRARLAAASRSRAIAAIGSGSGPSFAQVSGRPRMWVHDQPRVVIRHYARQLRLERQAGWIVNDLGSQFEGALGDFGLVGIDGDRNRQPILQALQDRARGDATLRPRQCAASPAGWIRRRYR